MKKYAVPVFGVIVLVAIAFVMGYSMAPQPKEVTVAGTVGMMIDYGNGTISTYEFDAQGTAFDLLLLAGQQDGFVVDYDEYEGLGVLVNSIAGMGPDHEAKDYWLYWVNAESPSVSASMYNVTDGDTIVWRYGFVAWA